jgi:hypothetical protein
MKHHLATLFGWRQPRHLPAQMMQMHVTLLMCDGTVTAQDVQIPDTTPLSGIIRAVAIQLFAQHDISGEVARIGEITLRASNCSAVSAEMIQTETLRSVK